MTERDLSKIGANRSADGKIVKNRGGRPRGSRTCQPDVPLKPSKRMVDLMSSCYDDAEWQRRFKQLPVVEQFRLRGGAEPKPKEAPTGNTFQLVIEGLGNKAPITCPKCQHTFTVAPTTQQEAPGAPIVPASTPEDDPNRPKMYVPSEKALQERAARDAMRASLPGDDWPDDGFPDV